MSKPWQRDGVSVIMATGDHADVAREIAAALGIDSVHAEVQPQEKAALIESLQGQGHVVAMAGDGVNDAPALSSADVGIALQHGSDIAIQSAAITLLGRDLNALLRARKLARETQRNIRQNLVFAFAYNAIGVPIAAGALYPVLGLTLSPTLAAAAMSLSSVSVIANAIRLRRV